MKCDLTLLSALSDGDLAEKQAARVRAHLASCESCRRELGAIEALRGQLSSLAAPEGEDAWLALSKKLAETPPRARISWRRWVLAPAFFAVAGMALWVQQRSRGPSDDALVAQAEAEFRGAEAQYIRALDKLSQVTARARAEWPAPRQREYDAARAALEAATEKCRVVARAQAADPDSEELLFAAYRKQIHFYQEQILRGESL